MIVDPGSYRYSGTTPWRNPFAGPESHSVLTGAGEHAVRFGRFLAVPQSPAEIIATIVDADGEGTSGRRSAVLCRRVTFDGTTLWRASGGQLCAVAQRNADDPASGWWSPRYAQLAPCTPVTVRLHDGGVTGLAIGDAPLLSEAIDALTGALPAGIAASWRALEFGAGERTTSSAAE